MKHRQKVSLRVVAGLTATAMATVGVNAIGASRHDFRRPTPAPVSGLIFEAQDGSGNNPFRPDWGKAGVQYVRNARPNYIGTGTPLDGPNARFVSNRIFNDSGQNLFDENNISQWGWAWGQFIDHDLGLRDETPGTDISIPFDATDPLEQFSNTTGSIQMSRTNAAPGTDVFGRKRQQINTITSYIDGSQVYGSDAARTAWLRDGAKLLLPDDYLPTPLDKPGAPPMDLMGRLTGQPNKARVAGDVRANENNSLTSIQTLFAREHNRIVDELPAHFTDDQKFNIARRLVSAEIQYITYNEFLPALGVTLKDYHGYKPFVNATLSNEFATTGFRAHSMVHGQFDVPFEDGDYTPEELASFQAQGVGLAEEDGEQSLQIPLSVAFGNPDLLQAVGLDSFLHALGLERQYQNDEQLDNTVRSILFEIPKPSAPDPAICQVPVVDPNCFTDVQDLGAIDVVRARDHGIPLYNDLRRAYGLPKVTSFTQITGEATDQLPPGKTINDPSIMDITSLTDADGNPLVPLSPDGLENGVHETRASTVAARLKAIYGTVDKIDAFTGMVSEAHVDGTSFGPLQLAIWKDQFTRTRDGDRFFYENDPVLKAIQFYLGIDYRVTLANVIEANTDTTVEADVFHIPGG